ncbi:hypothetical protein F4604DRAFT_1684385 [Suillus subluteus]|nr:hypothetical protein F4604DRAFT_1684385 [Suillus subluteus]
MVESTTIKAQDVAGDNLYPAALYVVESTAIKAQDVTGDNLYHIWQAPPPSKNKMSPVTIYTLQHHLHNDVAGTTTIKAQDVAGDNLYPAASYMVESTAIKAQDVASDNLYHIWQAPPPSKNKMLLVTIYTLVSQGPPPLKCNISAVTIYTLQHHRPTFPECNHRHRHHQSTRSRL